jgi:hypothetical protein
MKTTSFFGRPGAWLGLCITALVATPFAAAKPHLKISANGAAIDAFGNWTGATPWAEIKNYRNGNASRPVVDLLLQLQALRAGGLDFDFELVRTLTYEQAKAMVLDGRAQLTAETIWDDEINEHPGALLKTDAVIRDGEFVKGIYILPANQALLKLSGMDELRTRIGAVVSTWSRDLKTLEDMKLAGIVQTATPDLTFAAVKKGQADFTLAEFSSSPDMSSEAGGARLVPVPNCKVAIAGSRSWVVSAAAPDAETVRRALTAGIKVLRENGTLERAYRESGFFNPRVAEWKRIF